MFRVPLLEHLEMSNRSISYVIELCVCALLEKGMHEEGLLRVGCGESSLQLFYYICSVAIGLFKYGQH